MWHSAISQATVIARIRHGFKAVYLVIGINMNGEKEVLGLWIALSEGFYFWFQVVTELKNRDVQDTVTD